MKTMKLLFAAVAAVMMTGSAFAEKTAKAVLENSGKTLRFVYDDTSYGTKGTDWFSVAEAEAIVNPLLQATPWYCVRDAVTKAIVDASFAAYRPTQCVSWFEGFTNLTTITELTNLDTSRAVSMRNMFRDCEKLETLDLSNFNTANVTNMKEMVKNCMSLTTIYASELFVVDQVSDSAQMFSKCSNLVGGAGTKYSVSTGLTKLRAHVDGGTSSPGYFTYKPPAPTAKVVVADSGKTLKFVYDNKDYGTKGTDWFSVAEALDPSDDPPWYDCHTDVTKVVFDASFKTYKPKHCGNWFEYFELLAAIEGLENLDTSEATSFIYMFYCCSSLTSLDLSTFDTAKVTEMGSMFYGCSLLMSLDLSTFDTAKVEDMCAMFYGCSSLASLDLSSFDTSRVENMRQMFYECFSLTSLNISSFNTAKVDYIYEMFYDCSSLTSLDLSSFKTSNMSELEGMFYGCSSLTSLDLSSFNTANTTDMSSMFDGCTALKTIAVSERFVTPHVSSSFNMFNDCTALVGGEGTKYDSTMTDKTYARIDGGNDEPGYFTPVPAAKVVVGDSGKTLRFVYDMSDYGTMGTDWFSVGEAEDGAPYHDPPWCDCRTVVTKVVFDASFKTYKPKHCGSWFADFESLAAIEGLENLDTSEATSFLYMFQRCSSLMSLDLSSFNTAKVRDMSYMFYGCSSLTSLDLSSFNTAKVEDMSYIFCYCAALETLDISSFNTANATDMSSMFYDCTALKTVRVSEKFVTDQVTYSDDMFDECTALVGGKGTKYDSTKTDKTYARIDGGTAAPGYFTYKSNVPVGSFAIHFAADGGTGTMADQVCARGKVWQLTKNKFTKSGKTFKGWQCSNGKRYDDQILIFDLADSGDIVTMTAVWE